MRNLDLSKSDQAILKLIIDDLKEKNNSITPKNIRGHYLFDKMDERNIFKNENCSIIPVGFSLEQKGKEELIIKLIGTSVDLRNPIHRQFVESIITSTIERLIIFSKVTEELSLSDISKLSEDVFNKFPFTTWEKI